MRASSSPSCLLWRRSWIAVILFSIVVWIHAGNVFANPCTVAIGAPSSVFTDVQTSCSFSPQCALQLLLTTSPWCTQSPNTIVLRLAPFAEYNSSIFVQQVYRLRIVGSVGTRWVHTFDGSLSSTPLLRFVDSGVSIERIHFLGVQLESSSRPPRLVSFVSTSDSLSIEQSSLNLTLIRVERTGGIFINGSNINTFVQVSSCSLISNHGGFSEIVDLGDGGAIAVRTGFSLIVSRSNFSSNHAAIDRSGGAIAAMFPTADAHMFMYPAVIATNSSRIEIQGCSFRDNFVSSSSLELGRMYVGGGAIYAHTGVETLISAPILVSNCSFSNNSASSLAASYSGGGAMFTFHGWIHSSIFHANAALYNGKSSSTKFQYSGGGAIFLFWGTVNLSDFVDNCAISNGNEAFSGGGALLSISSTGVDKDPGVFVIQSRFLRNQADRNAETTSFLVAESGGGGIWAAQISIRNSYFINNSAVQNCWLSSSQGIGCGGGAVWMSFTSYVVDCIFDGNMALENGFGVSLSGSLGRHGGGGIFSLSASSVIQNSQFLRNVAYGNGSSRQNKNNPSGSEDGGGGLWCQGCMVVGSIFGWNSAVQNGAADIGEADSVAGSFNGGGGALLLESAISNSHFFNNTASRNSISTNQAGSSSGGGGLFASGSVISNSSFCHNVASNNGKINDALNGGGGVISVSFVTKSSSSILGFGENITLLYNVAVNGLGGGAVLQNTSWIHSFVSSNFAYSGGGLLLAPPFVTLKKSILLQNRVSDSGGGIALRSGGQSISVNEVVLKENRAGAGGGGFAVDAPGASLVSQHLFCIGNIGFFGGCGMVVSDGFWLGEYDIFVDNVALFDGGFLSLFGAGTASVRLSRVSSNSAPFGGAVSCGEQATFLATSSIFSMNFASRAHGGALFADGESHTFFLNTTFSQNRALLSGGVVMLRQISSLRIEDSFFHGNLAHSAGAIFFDDLSQAYLTNVSLHRNVGLFQCGALQLSGVSQTSIVASNFTENMSGSEGASYCHGNSAKSVMLRTRFENGFAAQSGACLYFSGNGALFAVDLYGYNNTASLGGCAFLNGEDAASIRILNSSFVQNLARRGDGGALNIGANRFNVSIENSEFIDNSAWRGGAISLNRTSQVTYRDVGMTLLGNTFGANYAYIPAVSTAETEILGLGGGGLLFWNVPDTALAWMCTSFSPRSLGSSCQGIDTSVMQSYLEELGNRFPFPFSSTSLAFYGNFFASTSFTLKFPSSLGTMPGVRFFVPVTIFDLFKEPISTLTGASVSIFCQSCFLFFRISSGSISDGSSSIPMTTPGPLLSNISLTLSSTLFSRTYAPSISILQSLCQPEYGMSSPSDLSIGTCVLCQQGLYSISLNHEACRKCPLEGALCFGGRNVDILSGFWPAVVYQAFSPGFASSSSPNVPVNLAVFPVICPFDWCSRSSASLGLVSRTSDGLLVMNGSFCRPDSFRDPTSVLCSSCLPGYSEWNHRCIECPGISGSSIFFHLFFIFIVVVVQHILAQREQNLNSFKELFFSIQISTFLFYPQTPLEVVAGYFNFQPTGLTSSTCPFPLPGYGELLVLFLSPFVYLILVWILFALHQLSAFLWRSICRPQSEFPDLFSNWAHPSNYIRTTILLSLSGYQPALVAVLTFWNCHSVPLGSEMLSLNALVPSISCDSSSYRSWTISFSFFTIFLAFIPALLLLWLWYARRRVRLKQHLSSEGSEWIMDELDAWSYGPLYSGYRSSVYAWESYQLMKRFILVLVFSLMAGRVITPALHLTLAAFLSMFWLIHYIVAPFSNSVNNTTESLSYICLIWISAIRASNIESGTRNLAGLLILSLLIFVLVFIPSISFWKWLGRKFGLWKHGNLHKTRRDIEMSLLENDSISAFSGLRG